MYARLNDKKDGFVRTNSICPPPESVLLDLVQKNDHESIERLVENNTELLNKIYPEYNKPILLIACCNEQVKPETVQTLICSGADIYYSSELDDEMQALHFAAYKTRSDILMVIIKNLGKPGDINATANGNNALHILIKHGKSDLVKEFVECAKILVEQGIDVNRGDIKGVSPILWAAKKGYKQIIKVILENSVVPVDLDSHQLRQKTARDIILSENLYDGPLPDKSDNNNETDESILFKYLQSGNENAFVNFKDGDIHHLVNANDNNFTLLQASCYKNLKRAVQHLIKNGADPNLTKKINGKTPVEIAAEMGYYQIFEILLRSENTFIPETLLINLLKNVDGSQHLEAGISHVKCYEILINMLPKESSSHLDITDDFGNSPLHYGVRYAEPEKVEELLELGASLGAKNNFGIMPIQDIEPEMLEKHLNNCIKFDVKTKTIDKEDFSVTFSYRTLIPPTKKTDYNIVYKNGDPETNFSNVITRELVAETEVISYMSKTPEFRHLLKHPVIVSFLFMKWHRIRSLFYTNLAFYISFFLSLVVYIFTSYANFDDSEKNSFEKFIVYVSWIVFFITYLILIFRELFQIAVSPKKYFKNFENYVEIVLILFTGSILYISDPSDDTRKILSSVSILLAAFELVLMVGQHPKFSTNVVMLRTVSFNFFKFLTWYSLLIIAFALSFYILFTDTEPANPKNKTMEGEEEEDFFTDPGKSVFKTIVMLTGEFDAGSLKFQQFPITSKIIFALFVFMIAIILLNLLNGLAVNDTQMIKTNAELVGHIARAQHIQYIESMILGNILPSKFIQAINNICCCCPGKMDYTFQISKPLAKRICLFPHYLNDKYELTVYLNSGQICLPHRGKKSGLFGSNCCTCSHIYLDKDTIKRTNSIVREKREALKVKQEENSYMRKIENIITALERNANDDKREIFNLNQKLDYILKCLSREKGS